MFILLRELTLEVNFFLLIFLEQLKCECNASCIVRDWNEWVDFEFLSCRSCKDLKSTLICPI